MSGRGNIDSENDAEEPNGEGDAPQDESQPPSLQDLADSIKNREWESGSQEPSIDVSLDTGEASSEPEAEPSFEWVEEMDTDPSEGRGLGQIDPSSHVLILGPARDSTCDRTCIDLLTRFDTARLNVVFVSITRTINNILSMWEEYTDASPADMHIITMGNPRGGQDTPTATVTKKGVSHDISIQTLSDPSDLTRLGVSLTRRFEDMEDPNTQTVLCFLSLSEILQYVDAQRLFRFLHILQSKLESIDAIGHFHIDPQAHEEQTVRVFWSLFDEVLQVTGPGEFEIVSESE